MRKSGISGGYNMKDVIHARAASHAFEGKVFNIASSGIPDNDAIGQVAGNDETLRDFLKNACPAVTMIVGLNTLPNRLLERKRVYADIGREIVLKGVHDIVVSYQRLDIFRLHVKRASLKPAHFSGEQSLPTAEKSISEETVTIQPAG